MSLECGAGMKCRAVGSVCRVLACSMVVLMVVCCADHKCRDDALRRNIQAPTSSCTTRRASRSPSSASTRGSNDWTPDHVHCQSLLHSQEYVKAWSYGRVASPAPASGRARARLLVRLSSAKSRSLSAGIAIDDGASNISDASVEKLKAAKSIAKSEATLRAVRSSYQRVRLTAERRSRTTSEKLPTVRSDWLPIVGMCAWPGA